VILPLFPSPAQCRDERAFDPKAPIFLALSCISGPLFSRRRIYYTFPVDLSVGACFFFLSFFFFLASMGLPEGAINPVRAVRGVTLRIPFFSWSCDEPFPIPLSRPRVRGHRLPTGGRFLAHKFRPSRMSNSAVVLDFPFVADPSSFSLSFSSRKAAFLFPLMVCSYDVSFFARSEKRLFPLQFLLKAEHKF